MNNHPVLTDHAYDGIQEYDNPLPGWWKWIFVGTIAFSVLYAMYFHIGAPGRTITDQYETALAANTRLQFAEIGDLQPDAATILQFMQQDSWLAVGQVVFKANCISCHGNRGEGKVGPNLTDDFYKNVRQVEDIARIVNTGAGNGAMPAWASRLHVNEVVLVSAFVANLRGTDVEGKEPEGNRIAAWPEPPEPVSSPATQATGDSPPLSSDLPPTGN